jgi:glycosyltransferase involved in cell wall biosynthesis
MRITMVLTRYYPALGGSENQARLQAAELVRRGHTVEVVTWRHEPVLPAHEVLDGVLVRRVRMGDGSVMSSVVSATLMAKELCRRVLGTDIVAAKGVNAPAHLAAVIAWVFRKPMIEIIAVSLDMPGMELNQKESRGPVGMIRRAAIRFSVATTISVAMTDSIESGLRELGSRRIVRIANGVLDPGPFDRGLLREELLAPLGVPGDAHVVVACGRLTWQKGFDILLKAWSRAEHRDDRFLVFVGSGPDAESLADMARDLGVSATVRFVSAEPAQAREYIACADVFVISSRYEGMANVLLEAMAAGIPVVSTPVSGSTDLIQDGYNGRIVPHDDPVALLGAIEAVLRDPGDMGPKGREIVLDVCGLGHVVDSYERLFVWAKTVPLGVTTANELRRLPTPIA